MNLHPGENRELTLSTSINPKKPTKRGCYLALTFGTLLSSQGADAHKTRPSRPSFAAAFPRYAVPCESQARGLCPRAPRLGRRHSVQPAVLRTHSRDPPAC